jgi:hypothetical protein
VDEMDGMPLLFIPCIAYCNFAIWKLLTAKIVTCSYHSFAVVS